MVSFRYGSVCSGIEAATAAWHPLGWEAAFFSEIEPFPRAVLAHHYPDVPLHGDFTTIQGDEYGAIDLLVGGTPCQSFSIAGLRGGLDDDRGNLALEFLRLAQRTRPKWLVWENVPGVLSSNGGRDFGSILGGMVECGYGFAYRVLDAQYFGVAQRRRRVFVIGCLGDPASAAAVLFERHSLQGYPSPRREKGQRLADTLTVGANQCSGFIGDITEDKYPEKVAARMVAFGEYDIDGTASTIKQRDYKDATDLIAFGWQNSSSQGDSVSETITPTLDKSKTPAIAIGFDAYNNDVTGDVSKTVDTGQDYHHVPNVIHKSEVRRLTPIECERLQGFQDNFTRIPWRNKQEDDCPDGPRYKALGNSMAVPVMRWIGERIMKVEENLNG
jgi:DNA (cytosine-5)-methyltransferase 1